MFAAYCQKLILCWSSHVWNKRTTNKVEAVRGRTQTQLEIILQHLPRHERFSNYCTLTGESRRTRHPSFILLIKLTLTANREKHKVNFSRHDLYQKKKETIEQWWWEKELDIWNESKALVGWLIWLLQLYSKLLRHKCNFLVLRDVSFRLEKKSSRNQKWHRKIQELVQEPVSSCWLDWSFYQVFLHYINNAFLPFCHHLVHINTAEVNLGTRELLKNITSGTKTIRTSVESLSKTNVQKSAPWMLPADASG